MPFLLFFQLVGAAGGVAPLALIHLQKTPDAVELAAHGGGPATTISFRHALPPVGPPGAYLHRFQ